MSENSYANKTGREIRELCRRGTFDRPTAGVARGFTQANLVVLPAELASDFETFCRLNPKPCPLLEVTGPGRFEPTSTAPGADLRTDLPRYRVYSQGKMVDRPKSILSYWPDATEPRARRGASSTSVRADARRPDHLWEDPARHSPERLESPSHVFVAFLIGCSFTFESALLEAGIPVRHIEEGCNVPMFRTNIPCKPAGRFAGSLIVSMRPMTPEQATAAGRVTAAYPSAHGSPVHIGDPHFIGIEDLGQPDYGDTVTIRREEISVFWACGVTPTEAIIAARPDIAITHEPGHMFVTDVSDRSLRNHPRSS